MNKSKSKADALLELVLESIAADPYELNGFKWCAMAQPDIALKLGFSVETLRRIISKPPFVRERTHKDGKPITLIREGIPGPMTTRHVANIMSRIWRSKFDRAVTRREYGCMVGLAENWPDGHQVEIFKLTISKEGWTEFMAGVHIDIELLGENGTKRFYSFPSLSLMRRFHGRAVELYAMGQQAEASAEKGFTNVNKSSTHKLKLKQGPHPALEALKNKKGKL